MSNINWNELTNMSKVHYSHCPDADGDDTIVFMESPKYKAIAIFQYENDADEYVKWMNGDEDEA